MWKEALGDAAFIGTYALAAATSYYFGKASAFREMLKRYRDTRPGLNYVVLGMAYGWQLDTEGEVHGLVAGDMGYEPTGIVIDDFKKHWREAE